MKIKCRPEGRENLYIPEKESLKEFIRSKKFKRIHNFVLSGNLILGANYSIKEVFRKIDKQKDYQFLQINQ